MSGLVFLSQIDELGSMSKAKTFQQMLKEAEEKGRNEGIREALQRLLTRIENHHNGITKEEPSFKDLKNVVLYSELVRKLQI